MKKVFSVILMVATIITLLSFPTSVNAVPVTSIDKNDDKIYYFNQTFVAGPISLGVLNSSPIYI